MLSRKAVLLVVAAIGVGAVGMAVSWVLSRDAHIEPEAYLRYCLVITLAVYAVVAVLLVTQITLGTNLRWRTGDAAAGILFGATVGGGLAGLLVALVSVAAGHLDSDPRVITLISEGDVAHIVVTLLITCACAPLIEEVLFRGVLLESVRRQHSVAAGVCVSAAAFAAWHLNPSALRYYAVMGVMFAVLYLRRGLICSISAHAAFNSVLGVAALAIVFAPTHLVQVGPVSLEAPGGWRQVTQLGSPIEMSGPSNALLLVLPIPTLSAPSAATAEARLRSGRMDLHDPTLSLDTATVRLISLPAGEAVEADISQDGNAGTIVYLPHDGESLAVVFMSGGSPRAQAQFPRILRSIHVS
jgi:membrane protease YdiL (CAAX protease family)